MIDFHCHILPGIDDGPGTISESVEMAALLAAAGFTRIYCSPHFIRGNYDVDSSQVHRGVRQLQDRLEGEMIGLELNPGREYYVDEFFNKEIQAPLLLGKTDLLLFEVPFSSGFSLMKEAVYQVVRQHRLPLLAHPERYPLMELPRRKWFSRRSREIGPAKVLKEMGCLFQGNLGSFAGLYGKQVMQKAVYFLEHGFYSCLGTDAHSPRHLEGILRKGLQKAEDIVGREEVGRLFQEDWLDKAGGG